MSYTFFWGGIFSQWSKQHARFTERGRTFVCCEQYMMYHKATIMGDHETAAKIMRTANPREHKRLGRQVKKFNKYKWDQVKRQIVYQGNLLRAQQNPQFAEALRNTGGKTIVEASPHDAIWGIGFDEATAMKNRDKWGQNLLGKALMRVRQEIA